MLLDQFARNAAGPDDLLLVVDVVEEGVEGDDPLLDALRELAPFAAGNDARDKVEGDELFGAVRVSVDREGDAGLAEDIFRVAGFGNQMCPVLGCCTIRRISHRAGAGLFVPSDHFIKCQRCGSPFFVHLSTTQKAMQEACAVEENIPKTVFKHQKHVKTPALERPKQRRKSLLRAVAVKNCACDYFPPKAHAPKRNGSAGTCRTGATHI